MSPQVPFVLRRVAYWEYLSSQMAVRCISKVVEANKWDKSIPPTFHPHGAMVYDERIMSFQAVSHVSFLTLSGRVLIPLRFGAYQAARMDRIKGQADLILRGGTFYLDATIDLPSPPPMKPVGVIGVDLGIAEIASDSEGHQYSGEPVKALRCRVRPHRR